MALSLLRTLLLLAPLAAWALWATPGSDHSAQPSNALQTVPLGLSLAAESNSPGASTQDLLNSAIQAAERSDRAETTEAAHAAEIAQAAALGALARSPQAADLPWNAWIQAELRNRDSLAYGLYLAAEAAQAPGALERAIELSVRSSPVPLRIAAHRSLWRLDRYRALRAGQKLALEPPRGTTALHANYVLMLADLQDPLAEELLSSFAVRDSAASMARSIAIRALVATGKVEYAYVLAPIWKSTSSDRATRQLALVSALTLDPQLEQQLLFEDVPSRQDAPLLRQFVSDVRAQRGLPPLDDSE